MRRSALTPVVTRLVQSAAAVMLAAVCGACAVPPARVPARGPAVTALPDPCSLVSFALARRLVPGLTSHSISHDGSPDTGRNRIPTNTECIWANDPVTAARPRQILIALQLFTGTDSATGSDQAHQYLVIAQSPDARPVAGLGDEALLTYSAEPGHWSEAKVTFRLGNEVAVIQYGGFDRRAGTWAAITKSTAMNAALTLARDVLGPATRFA